MKKNLNTKTDGYFEMWDNGKYIGSVYGKLIKDGATICKKCGKIVTRYMEIYYIDENDNEISANYGTECFKKMATWDKSIIAL